MPHRFRRATTRSRGSLAHCCHTVTTCYQLRLLSSRRHAVCKKISPVTFTPMLDTDSSAVIASGSGKFTLYVVLGQQSGVDASTFDIAGTFGNRPSSGIDSDPVSSFSSTNDLCSVLAGLSTTGNVATDASTTPSDVSGSVGVASLVEKLRHLSSRVNAGVQSSPSVGLSLYESSRSHAVRLQHERQWQKVFTCLMTFQ